MPYSKLPSLYQQFIHLSRYARWIDGENRRETWEETVDRYINFMCDFQCKDKIPIDIRKELREAILNLEVMPSMRCMMTAGEALKRDAAAAYNCSGVILDDISAFDEMLYLLMVGVGVGFSVERQFIAKLPTIADKLRPSKSVIKVEDSRLGWAVSYKEMMSMLYQGRIPEWDVSEVRPAGAKLKTFGGRASGPQPLVDLFKFTIETFKQAAGRKLNSIECHDICCKIGEIVVVGGVRRCLEIGTEVFMDDELWKPIEEIKTGDRIWFEGESLPVTDVIDNGIQEMVEIEMEDGGRFRCTENHRWYVLDHSDNELKWVEAKNLSSGEYSFIEPEAATTKQPI